MPRLSLPLLCFGIILVQLDEGRFITKARPKKYDCSEIEKYSRENALQTSGKSVEGEVANWWKGQMPLCSRTQWSFESLADQNSEFLCWRFQFCAQLTPSNEKYWQKGTRKFYSQAIWPSFSRPSTQEGRGTWLTSTQSAKWAHISEIHFFCIKPRLNKNFVKNLKRKFKVVVDWIEGWVYIFIQDWILSAMPEQIR